MTLEFLTHALAVSLIQASSLNISGKACQQPTNGQCVFHVEHQVSSHCKAGSRCLSEIFLRKAQNTNIK